MGVAGVDSEEAGPCQMRPPGVPMHLSQQVSVSLATVCCICALACSCICNTNPSQLVSHIWLPLD